MSAVRSGGEDELKDFHKNSSWNTWNERNDDDWMEKSQKLLNDLSKCKYSTKFQQNDVNDDKIEKKSGELWKKMKKVCKCQHMFAAAATLDPALQIASNCEKVDEEGEKLFSSYLNFQLNIQTTLMSQVFFHSYISFFSRQLSSLFTFPLAVSSHFFSVASTRYKYL